MSSYVQRLQETGFDAYKGNHAPVPQATSAFVHKLVTQITNADHPHLLFSVLTQLHGNVPIMGLHTRLANKPLG